MAITSQAGTAFKASVQTSPTLLDSEDAEKVVIPMALLASKDEDSKAVRAFEENLTV